MGKTVTLRDSHPVLSEVMAMIGGSELGKLPEDCRARIERVLSLRPDDQRQAGIRNIVRFARWLEQDLKAPEAAGQLLDAIADLSFTDPELRAALKQATERLSAASERLRATPAQAPTIRAHRFAIPMRG